MNKQMIFRAVSPVYMGAILSVVYLFSAFGASAQQANPPIAAGGTLLQATNNSSLSNAWNGSSNISNEKDYAPQIRSGKNGAPNYTSFSQPSIYSGSEVKTYNADYLDHPELGVLFTETPCSDCYELIGKRTATEKYFVKEGTEASEFALQSSLYPMHYKDAEGRWMTINKHLQKSKDEDGVYFTENRPYNITINAKKGYCMLTGKKGSLTYNDNLALVYQRPDGTEVSLGNADWSNFTAGDDGVRIVDAWPGIDIEIGVMINSLKTNYVIKSPMGSYSSGKLLIKDDFNTSGGLSVDLQEGSVTKEVIKVTDESGNEVFTINKALGYPKVGDDDALTVLNFKKGTGNRLDIEIPGSLLDQPASAYPYIIDPLVAGTLSSGFTYTSGTWPPAITSTSEFCTNTNSVTIPAAATLTDIQLTFTYYGPPATSWGQSRLAFQVSGGCTWGWLSCSAAASSSGIPGNTCGLLNRSVWSTSAAWGTTAGCLPAFSCSSYTLPFQLLLTQQASSTAACSQTVYATATGFTVTVYGTTAILPSITPPSGTTLCMPSTLTLLGSPAGGTWLSTATGVATVSGGVLTGVSNGTTSIEYTSSGCTASLGITVGTTPTVTGTPRICFPGTTSLTGTPTGGTWSSSATGVATITTGGLVTGVSIGTTLINYNTGTCSATVPVDVNSPTAVTPTTQPTGITFTGVTASGATVNFTPNGSSGYLVIASTSPTLYASPTTYTTYATGSSFGGGIVIQGSTSGSAPAYTTTLLNSNTHYYIFVFAFNNNCTGPQYNLSSPLTGNFNTCVGATGSPTVGTTGVNFINISWTASPAGGGHVSPINYTVYAYTDAGLTTLAPGFPVAAGTGTSYTLSGLTPGAQYWFRVAPSDACAIMSGVATAMTTCSAAGSIPYLQTFEVSTILGDRSPNCMTSNVQNCVFSGVQTSVTYIGTISTNHTSGGSKFYNFFRGGACSAGWANQWLLLPPLTMNAGTTYTLSFWYVTSGPAWAAVDAQVSSVSTVPAVTSTTMGGTPVTIGPGLAGISNTTYAQYIQTFTIPATGTYYVGIDARSGGGAGLLAIDDIEVCAMPDITLSNATAPYCDPDTVTLVATGLASAISYSWSGPSGFTSTLASLPPFTGLTPGTYTYSLTAVNDPISAGFGGYCSVTETTTFTINSPPAAITGGTSICTGQTTTLANTVAGGSWSSSVPAVGTVDASGVVTGITAGTTTITYDIGGCFSTKVVTVTAMPAAISGIRIACLGSTTTLSNSVTGGTWSSSNGNATVGTPSSGVITGSALGTSIITYSMGAGCLVTAEVTVNPTPDPITGPSSICVGITDTLFSSPAGGIWTSSAPGVASVFPTTGVISASAIGTTTISYRAMGCSVTKVVTVVSAPTPIVGPSTVCLYYPTITLTNLSSGGTWVSSNANVTIGTSSGIVTGNTTGTSTITYSLSAGCVATKVVTVLPAPAAFTGTLTVCEGGGTSTLSHSVTGGTWISGSANATVGFATGEVTGVTAGTAAITYTLPTGCVAIGVVTVSPVPSTILGSLTLCQGATSTLSSATSGVTWTSGSPGTASVDISSGVVTGHTPGTATIVATSPVGCQTSTVVTVNPLPSAITGTPSLCVGGTSTLTSSPSVTWSSTNASVATVSASGVVTGVSADTVTIVAAAAGGCYVDYIMTVNAAPAAITGTSALCVGYTVTLGCLTPGGVWSTSDATVGSILSPGLAAGVSAGTATISYTVAGCSSTFVITVNTVPGSISGGTTVCIGEDITLSAAPSGGTWTSSSPNVIVDIATGEVTGTLAGTAEITYSLGSGCISTEVITVNSLPSLILGTTSLCQGGTSTLSSTPSGGTWFSSDVSVATIGVGTGSVTTVGTGTSTISYTLPTGCRATSVLTVNSLPAPITGVTNVCVGATTALSTTSTGGTWSSSNGNATVDILTGVVTGSFQGTSTISYIMPTGCFRTTVVLVNPAPSSILGSIDVCEGSTSSLTGAPSGGTWSSSASGTASITAGSGVLSGVAAGNADIVYTLPTGCSLSVNATVNPLPGPITGTLTVCMGQTTTLSSTTPGGTWSSGNPAVATISSGGIVTGIDGGSGSRTATITYTLPTGCYRTETVTVFNLPGIITGSANACVGQVTTLNCLPSGGTWASGAPGVAVVDATTGDVTGISTPGTATITYTVGTGCFSTKVISVNPLPDPITGTADVCEGQTTMLSTTTPSGTWSSTATGTATIDPSTGLVTGISGTATATIRYTVATSCYSSQVVTVYALPSAITGTLQVCEGQTTALTNTSSGGSWTTADPSIGTIDASTGVVTGVSFGTTMVTYTLGTGCYSTAILTVNPLPDPITGINQVCVGATTTLSSATSGGTWTSSDVTVATVSGSGGVVTGILAGTAVITYRITTGCYNTRIVSVNALPDLITGPTEVCVNSSVTLIGSPSGGTWASGSANASVGVVSGSVTGIASGTATISYIGGVGCVRTRDITIHALPDTITGNAGVCIGFTTMLATTSTTGVWSSTSAGVATIDASGLVTSVSVGTTTISYTSSLTGCASTRIVTVNPLPDPIVGSDGFCNLSSTTYTSTPGGTWSSADPSIISIDPTTGVATGLTVDTTDIIITLPTGCSTSKSVYLILAPFPITGPDRLCVGQNDTLENAIGGGVWSSSNTSIVPVDVANGAVNGLATGTANITYVLSTGCLSVQPMTVNPVPSGNAGPREVCEGLCETLYNITPGGTWSSDDLTIATIDSATGVYCGVDGGTTGLSATIRYSLGSGCNSSVTVTVNPLPDDITGYPQVCEGLTTTLYDSYAGGVWSSSNPSLANIDASTGVMTGLYAGTATITYTLPTSCLKTQQVTVNPLPAAIVGATDICVDGSTTLTNPTPGGSWMSSDTSIATVDISGVVTGVAPGSVIISYVLPTSCQSTYPMTINANPDPITGSLSVCAGFATNLSSGPSGGVWTMGASGATYGSINGATGVVSGVRAGVIPVTYTLGSGCQVTEAVTVVTLPSVISGVPVVCVNDTTVMTNPIAGGIWSISNTRATIDAATGVVVGVSAGTAVVTYTVGTGCFNVHTITVNPLPDVITGPGQVCENATITLASATTGGIWSSSATPVATVDFLSGLVTGESAGTVNITYAFSTGCIRVKSVTVNQTPYPIQGNPHICIGSSNTFTDTLPGGVWYSGNTSVATIGATTGVLASVSLGTTVISYRLPTTGCQATREVTVQPLPTVYDVTISDTSGYCTGGAGVSIGLNGSQPGVSYVLFRGSTATGYVSGTGSSVDFGLHTAAGTYSVQATNVTSGCKKDMRGSATVIVKPLVTPSVLVGVTPYDSVCPGQPVLVTPIALNEGPSPSYLWKVNGVNVSTTSSYSFVPADGDVVSVVMTGSADCASTPTAIATKVLTVLPNELPIAGVLVTPNDTVCQYNPTTFTANPMYGGVAPAYRWFVNGTVVGTGNSYTYVPVDADEVYCEMTSSYRCRLSDTVLSGVVNMSVDSIIIPHVSVYPDPGFVVEVGKPVTLLTSVTGAGDDPKYQWKRNGYDIPGATSDTYTGVFSDYDSISCVVTSSGVCANVGTHDWVFISTAPLSVSTQGMVAGNLRLMPNPNRGTFTVKGSLGVAKDAEINADITNMLGQVVYRGVLKAKRGEVDAQIVLDKSLANGMYLLTLQTQEGQKVFHFVMEQ